MSRDVERDPFEDASERAREIIDSPPGGPAKRRADEGIDPDDQAHRVADAIRPRDPDSAYDPDAVPDEER